MNALRGGARIALLAALGTGATAYASLDASPVPASSHRSISAHPVRSGIADELTAEQKQGIERVRNATRQFRQIETATEAGYTEQYPAGCAQSPDGAQGFHYMNKSLVDGTIDLLHPELVMYEPQADGSMQLIGVDYVVPFSAWTSSAAPTLLGMPFMRNEPLGVWALHIWAWRTNPSGAFAMWNPNASCHHAK